MTTTRMVQVGNAPVSTTFWEGTSVPVLGVHGISSTGRLWSWLKREMPELSLIAPDLPGRGGTPARKGVSSIRRHADLLVALLDELEIDRIHLVGNSLGAFIGMQLGAWHADRLHSLTLLDGGLPIRRGSLWPQTVDDIPVLLKDRYDRRGVVWPSRQAYREFFVRETAPLLDIDDPVLDAYLAYDLTEGDGGEVRLDLDVLSQDASSLFLTDLAEDALAHLAVPTRIVYAEWGSDAGTEPMYETADIEAHLATSDHLLSAHLVPGCDHAAIPMSAYGAAASARVVRQSIGLEALA